MYMATEATMDLWERLESSLRVGGLLVLGKAERPLGSQTAHPALALRLSQSCESEA